MKHVFRCVCFSDTVEAIHNDGSGTFNSNGKRNFQAQVSSETVSNSSVKKQKGFGVDI